MEKDAEVTHKTPFSVETPNSNPQVDTPVTVYQPSEALSISLTEEETFCETSPRDHLNAFLASRWDLASERTKRFHARKAKQVVNACLEEIAPQDHQHLLEHVVNAHKACDNIDSTLLEALTECYNNASHWSTRRQILSIIADKITYKDLQKWIPDLSRYRCRQTSLSSTAPFTLTFS